MRLAFAKGSRKEESDGSRMMKGRTAIFPFGNQDTLETAATWHIHLQGRVQGVGFRPYVYQMATERGLHGAVSNGLDGVHIWLTTNRENAVAFAEALTKDPPPLAVITGMCVQPAVGKFFHDFGIIAVEAGRVPNLWVPPDFSLCASCKADLEDTENRRYHYPFITCAQCGPRYSVIQALPFERHLTTMESFHLCVACRHEFNNPADRRFYAQTMSCPDCGVQLEYRDASGNRLDVAEEDIISSVTDALRRGLILAVKGIGGFLLMADASNNEAIQRLRQRKHRPAKPFAIMYGGLSQLQNDLELSEQQKAALTSPEAPIVLLPISRNMRNTLAVQSLAPGLDKLGIMLPYAPLLHMLLQSFDKPCVATSGNISGGAICYTNNDALNYLNGIADYFLLHNRDIVAPQDDSVISIPVETAPAIILRRSRGYAPACEVYQTSGQKSMLATGALMKSSFAIAHHHRVYVSQYLGHTDGYEAQQAYRHTLGHMQRLLAFQPEIILADKHPQYFSHQHAREIAQLADIPMATVQHHKAHFAAILGEAGLSNYSGRVLGIVWDGTGLGDDGNIWGGEFFIFEQNRMERVNHFSYFPYLLGDKMAVEPRLSALSAMHGAISHHHRLQVLFTETEWNLYQEMLNRYEGVYTSSVGRLYDAAACLITGMARQTYEGEAAMRLEALANRWCRANGLCINDHYDFFFKSGEMVSTSQLLLALVEDLNYGKEPAYIAARFHATLAAIVATMALHHNVSHVCCSGGVFQNSLLVHMIFEKFSGLPTLHLHKYLSPNDENISFGQLVYADKEMQ